MKKLALAFLVTLMLVSVTGIPALAADNYDAPWTLSLNSTVSGFFDDATIKTADYYKLTTTQDGALTLEVSGTASMRPHEG